MDISFGVVTYNSEKTIIETLESIRIQVEQFGRKHNNYLVISDDCSDDNTFELINLWSNKYKKLFDDVKIMKTKVNSGLCANYERLIKNISTNVFIQLAGDDLLSSESVYEKLSTLDEHELRVHLTLEFCGSTIWNRPENMRRQLFYSKYKHTNKRDIALLETVSPYSSVEICFFKKHYSDKCMDYMRTYRNFEDNTSLYYVLKNNKNVKFRFVMTPIVLYRREENSLTKMVDTTSQIAFLDDLYRFRKETFKNEKNFFVKVFLAFILWDGFLMKHRFDSSKCINRKITKMIENIQNKIVQKDSELQEYLVQYEKIVERENEHLKTIQNNASHFLKNELESVDQIYK